MIQENYSFEQTKNILLQSFTALKLTKNLCHSGIRKSKNISVVEVLKSLVFESEENI